MARSLHSHVDRMASNDAKHIRRSSIACRRVAPSGFAASIRSMMEALNVFITVTTGAKLWNEVRTEAKGGKKKGL